MFRSRVCVCACVLVCVCLGWDKGVEEGFWVEESLWDLAVPWVLRTYPETDYHDVWISQSARILGVWSMWNRIFIMPLHKVKQLAGGGVGVALEKENKTSQRMTVKVRCLTNQIDAVWSEQVALFHLHVHFCNCPGRFLVDIAASTMQVHGLFAPTLVYSLAECHLVLSTVGLMCKTRHSKVSVYWRKLVNVISWK